MTKKGLALLILGLFLAGLLPTAPGIFSQADARARKKKVVRLVKKAKKIKKARTVKRVKKVIKAKKATAKAKKRLVDPAYQLPARTGTVTQRYTLAEGVDETGADNLVGELKGIGADEASVNADSNTLTVKFNARELSAVGIIKKLKELGDTVKRIN